MSAKGELFFPVINVTDCVTKSKNSRFDGDVGKGCAFALHSSVARVFTSVGYPADVLGEWTIVGVEGTCEF